MAVAIMASVTREASVPVRLAMASMARCAAGELNRACQYRGSGRPASWAGSPNVCAGMCLS